MKSSYTSEKTKTEERIPCLDKDGSENPTMIRDNKTNKCKLKKLKKTMTLISYLNPETGEYESSRTKKGRYIKKIPTKVILDMLSEKQQAEIRENRRIHARRLDGTHEIENEDIKKNKEIKKEPKKDSKKEAKKVTKKEPKKDSKKEAKKVTKKESKKVRFDIEEDGFNTVSRKVNDILELLSSRKVKPSPQTVIINNNNSIDPVKSSKKVNDVVINNNNAKVRNRKSSKEPVMPDGLVFGSRPLV